MRRVKAILATVLMCMCAGVPADDAQSRAAAERLLEAMDMEGLLQRVSQRMLTVQLSQNPGLEPHREIVGEFLQQQMGYASLKDDLIGMYAESFTLEELDQIATFYETPVGRKTLEVMPQLLERSGRIGAQRVRDNVQQLRDRLTAAEAERREKLPPQDQAAPAQPQ